MKENIHPAYGECKVTCACGEVFYTGSVKKEMRVDICSKCHPFFTGKQKLVDIRYAVTCKKYRPVRSVFLHKEKYKKVEYGGKKRS